MNKSVAPTSIKRVVGTSVTDIKDMLVIEDPLEIRLIYTDKKINIRKSISVTMRTPGADNELAIGFLFTEGIINSLAEVKEIYNLPGNQSNVICIEFNDGFLPDIEKASRNFFTSSSCGICGKTSIESIKTACVFNNFDDKIIIPLSIVYSLPNKLKDYQSDFEKTGGLHACALFTCDGNLLIIKEDVGRHNALDKLVGFALFKDMLPVNNHILLLSGRVSFEMMQKAIMAGIKIVAAFGAPSSMAVEMAEDFNITLIGFLNNNRFNIYSGSERIVI